jgi:hypothetical protein
VPIRAGVELARPGGNNEGETPFPAGASRTYSLDSLHPDRLLCDRCGHALPVALDAWDDPESLRMLTEDAAAAYWPGLAADLRLHGMLCPEAWFVAEEAAEAMAAAR